MPRGNRKLSASKVYHIMVRGNEKKDIFLDDKDRSKFLDILRDKKKAGEYYLYAYCLMSNHVHLVIKEGTDEISKIMKRINTSYAYYYNKKYKRVGHVFQDRFKSEGIDNDRYLLSVIRYVHNNPVKAGLVKAVPEYVWSSYSMYMDEKAGGDIINSKEILEMFSTNYQKAIVMFIGFTALETKEEFVECTDEKDPTENIENARSFISEYFLDREMTIDALQLKNNRELRDETIRVLKEEYKLSVRTIADMLGLNRNVVQRVW